MVFNGSMKINSTEGDYIVLADYGQEGLGVVCQADTLEGALNWMSVNNHGTACTVVKLVHADVTETS